MSEHEPWGDDRLAAAFAARADDPAAATPIDLASATIKVVRDQAADSRSWRQRTRPLVALLGAAVVVAVVAAVTLGPRLSAERGAATAPPATVPASIAPSDGPSPPIASESAPVSSVFGLPVISVPDALAVRSTDDDRELAVRGWFSPYPAIPCPYRDVKLLLQEKCPDQYRVLQPAPVDALPQGSAEAGVLTPPSPDSSFQLYLDDVDSTWLPIDHPVELVVVGHFDDRRAAYCPKDEQQACRDRFVVDRVDRVDGVEQPLSAENLSEPLEGARVPDLDRLRTPLGDALILSVLMGEVHDGLPYREPLVSERSLGLSEIDAVWFFRVLVDDTLQTYVRIDGDEALYQVDRQRLIPADPPGGPAAGATTAPLRTSPPAVAPEPTEPEGHGWLLTVPSVVRPISIMVEDLNGLLTDARVATEAELAGAPGTARGASVSALAAGQVLVTWPGSGCDISSGVWVSDGDEAGAATIDVSGQRRACDTEAIERGVVLDLGFGVDPAKLSIFDHQVTRTFPVEILGLPVRDVRAAVAIRDAGADDREIAVAAWWDTGAAMICPITETKVSPLQPDCDSDRIWLLDEPELLQFRSGPMVRSLTPTVAAIHPTPQTVMTGWPTSGDPYAIFPVPIVAIGHFDDPGAVRCPPKDATWCRDTFVIDRIAWAIDTEVGASQTDADATSTPEEIRDAVDQVAAQEVTLMVSAISGEGLPFGELGGRSWPKALLDSNRLWWVKRLEDGRARSYVVTDKGHRVYRLEDDGSARRL